MIEAGTVDANIGPSPASGVGFASDYRNDTYFVRHFISP
jgi:hypothetical protein